MKMICNGLRGVLLRMPELGQKPIELIPGQETEVPDNVVAHNMAMPAFQKLVESLEVQIVKAPQAMSEILDAPKKGK